MASTAPGITSIVQTTDRGEEEWPLLPRLVKTGKAFLEPAVDFHFYADDDTAPTFKGPHETTGVLGVAALLAEQACLPR